MYYVSCCCFPCRLAAITTTQNWWRGRGDGTVVFQSFDGIGFIEYWGRPTK